MDSLLSYASFVNLPDDPGFATYFTHLRKTKTCVDVIFILETPEGDKEFYAHQLILAMRSVNFADKFYGNQKKQEFQTIRLGKVNTQAFEDMIRYCYGVKPGLDSTEEACALFKVAKKFNVTSLMNSCRASLKGISIEPGNVFSMLEVAEYMGDKSLTDMCYKVMEEKTREVVTSYADNLHEVNPGMVHTLLELPKLSFYSEYELLKWMIEWGKVKSAERDSCCENAREYLQKLLQDMNFLALTFEEFAMLCKEYPDFFGDYEIASIYLNIAHPGTREMPDWYDRDVKIRAYTGVKK